MEKTDLQSNQKVKSFDDNCHLVISGHKLTIIIDIDESSSGFVILGLIALPHFYLLR